MITALTIIAPVLAVTLAARAAEPRALLVAAANPAVPGQDWPPLAAEADVDLLERVLESQGVDVLVLRGEAATPAAVLGALEAELAAVGEGGHVLLHVSSHGTRVRDADGDELDGWDEALVLYPGASPRPGSWLLTDDALASGLAALRRRLGPSGSVAVTLDACHAAGATRGRPRTEAASLDWGWSAESGVASGGQAPLVVLAGSREDEEAQDVRGPEGARVGAFSLALAETLGTGAASWGDVHAGVRYRVASRVRGQRPVLSGPPSTPVFGRGSGALVSTARVVARLDHDTVRLDRGWIHGLEVGDKVLVSVDAQRIPGVVERVGVVDARVHVEGGGRDLASAQVEVVAAGPGHRLRVAIDPDGPSAAALRAAVMGDPLLALVDRADGADVWRDAAGATGPVPWTDDGTLRALALRARVVRLSTGGSARRVEPRLVSAAPGSCAPAGPVPRAVGGEAVVRIGETVGLELRHDGEYAAFVTVLHEDAEGRIQQLAPGMGEDFVERRPGDRWTLPGCWRVAPPVGSEVVHVLASRAPVDLRPLLRGAPGGVPGLDGVTVSAVDLAVLPAEVGP